MTANFYIYPFSILTIFSKFEKKKLKKNMTKLSNIKIPKKIDSLIYYLIAFP